MKTWANSFNSTNHEKQDEWAALEAILYIAQQSKSPTFHHISKLLYFADRKHLKNYGRFICGDDYVAMKHGPVPSMVYDMLKEAKRDVSYIQFEGLADAFTVENGYRVKPLRGPDLEWLSDSDLECLDWSIQQYDSYSFRCLAALSHDKAWEAADENDFISIENIIDSLGSPEGLLEHLQDPHPDAENDTVSSFRRGWAQALAGDTISLDELWDGIDAE